MQLEKSSKAAARSTSGRLKLESKCESVKKTWADCRLNLKVKVDELECVTCRRKKTGKHE